MTSQDRKVISKYITVASFGIKNFSTVAEAKEYIKQEGLSVYNLLEHTVYEDGWVGCVVLESKNWFTPNAQKENV